MLTTTQTVTVNAAFLQEIKDDDIYLKTLMSKLLETCTMKTAVDIDSHELASFLEELRDQVAMHFSLEEAYGYFDCPVSVSPRFSETAVMLRGQHSTLYEEIASLAEYAAEVVGTRSWQKQISRTKNILGRMRDFHGQMSRHEAAEDEMLLESFNVDIGGEG